MRGRLKVHTVYKEMFIFYSNSPRKNPETRSLIVFYGVDKSKRFVYNTECIGSFMSATQRAIKFIDLLTKD